MSDLENCCFEAVVDDPTPLHEIIGFLQETAAVLEDTAFREEDFTATICCLAAVDADAVPVGVIRVDLALSTAARLRPKAAVLVADAGLVVELAFPDAAVRVEL